MISQLNNNEKKSKKITKWIQIKKPTFNLIRTK
jgi:hypothetical protein